MTRHTYRLETLEEEMKELNRLAEQKLKQLSKTEKE